MTGYKNSGYNLDKMERKMNRKETKNESKETKNESKQPHRHPLTD